MTPSTAIEAATEEEVLPSRELQRGYCRSNSLQLEFENYLKSDDIKETSACHYDGP